MENNNSSVTLPTPFTTTNYVAVGVSGWINYSQTTTQINEIDTAWGHRDKPGHQHIIVVGY